MDVVEGLKGEVGEALDKCEHDHWHEGCKYEKDDPRLREEEKKGGKKEEKKGGKEEEKKDGKKKGGKTDDFDSVFNGKTNQEILDAIVEDA